MRALILLGVLGTGVASADALSGVVAVLNQMVEDYGGSQAQLVSSVSAQGRWGQEGRSCLYQGPDGRQFVVWEPYRCPLSVPESR